MRYVTSTLAYLGIGAIFHIVFVGATFDFMNAWTWVWLFAWPFGLVAAIIAGLFALIMAIWVFALAVSAVLIVVLLIGAAITDLSARRAMRRRTKDITP